MVNSGKMSMKWLMMRKHSLLMMVLGRKSGHFLGPTFPHAYSFACPRENRALTHIWISMTVFSLYKYWFLWSNTYSEDLEVLVHVEKHS